VQLAARREEHPEVTRLLAAVHLDGLVDLVELGAGLIVDLAVVRAETAEDGERLLAVARLEEPPRGLCAVPKDNSQVSGLAMRM